MKTTFLILFLFLLFCANLHADDKPIVVVADAPAPATYVPRYHPHGSAGALNPGEEQEFDLAIDEIIENVCGYQGRITQAKAEIARQKAIQKETGTMDLNAMHTAGAILVDMRAQLEQHLSTYKKVMGEDLKSNCQ